MPKVAPNIDLFFKVMGVEKSTVARNGQNLVLGICIGNSPIKCIFGL